MVDVIAYEMTIERVKRSDPRIPHYQTKALANSLVKRSLREAGFTSFLWLHPDQSVSEWYANDAARTNAVYVKSVSKALFSALVGVDKTLDLNAPIASFAGCAVPDALQPLSFETLLNMTAGFTFTENVSSDIYAAPNWGCRAMQLPSEARSGARFNYNTLQYHLAGLALAEYRGVDVATLFQNEVLDAMEIQLDGWIKNSDGDVFTGSEMRLHPKDMLRFGEVYLNDGRFNGKHIIPKSWITQSRQSQRSDTGRVGIDYSYGWWLTKLAGYEAQFAEGYGGQAIVVVPEAEQVFVFTAPTGGLVSGKKHDARMARLLALTQELLK